MPEYSLKELLELDMDGARKAVKDYTGPDKREFAKKVSCIVRCHKPVDEKITEYAGLIQKYPDTNTLKETAEKIAHLYLVSTDGFPNSRDHVALACIYVAPKINQKLPNLSVSKLIKLKLDKEDRNQIKKYFPDMDSSALDSDTVSWSDSLTKYIRSVVGNVLTNFTTIKDINHLFRNFNYGFVSDSVFQLFGEVYDHYADFIKPCGASEIEKLDASKYEKNILPLLESKVKVRDARKSVPRAVSFEIFTEDYAIRKIYRNILDKFNFFDKPVSEKGIPIDMIPKFKSMEKLGLIEYNKHEREYLAKNRELLKSIQILAAKE